MRVGINVGHFTTGVPADFANSVRRIEDLGFDGASLHILRPGLPIRLGAEGPRNVALAAEIADGWHAMLFAPTFDGFLP